jgi:hypothetical protein
LSPRVAHVGFVVDEMRLGRVFSKYFRFPLPIFIPPMLRVHLSSGLGTDTSSAAVSTVDYGNEGASSSVSDVDRYVIIRKFIFSTYLSRCHGIVLK